MPLDRPGELIDSAPHIPEIDYGSFRMRVSTDRFRSPEYHERERERLWMRVWQITGREDELLEIGDWKVYTIFDQSFVLVRGRDREIRGFVNSCRHRGNAFCEGKGHSARFTCPYHNWSYGLDGQLLAVAKPDFTGTVEEFVGAAKEELGLVRVPVECFAGFIFLNPDPHAAPLADFLGKAGDLLAPYRLGEMIPVGMNVRETIDCNWKIVMDAFHESYHVQGVHPELVSMVDLSEERFERFGAHGACMVPFGAPKQAELGPEQEVEMIRGLPPANFPGVVEMLPRFEQLVAAYQRPDGTLDLPEGVTPRVLMQQATRETMTAKGLDVSALTDNQMSDFQFWLLFPNVFIQVRAGEATVVQVHPHPDGSPTRCIWHVTAYMWLPPSERAAKREPLVEVAENDHYPYFLALEQDYEQMERQQDGLRNKGLEYMTLTRQEPRVILFHSMLDRWLE